VPADPVIPTALPAVLFEILAWAEIEQNMVNTLYKSNSGCKFALPVVPCTFKPCAVVLDAG
jgi:hypothetical protein